MFKFSFFKSCQQKVEDMAAEFLLTFLAVLVQLGLPTRRNQHHHGKELDPEYFRYRSVILQKV